MQNKYFIVAVCLLCFLSYRSKAQDFPADSVRKTSNGSFTFNFSNVGLENWAGGGQNAISVGGIIDLKSKRESARTIWQNNFNLAVGAAQIGGKGNLFKKTDDQLIASTQYGYKLTSVWSLGIGAEIRTQVLAGYTFYRDAQGNEKRGQVISNFLSPGYLNTNVFGVSYNTKHIVATFSPTFGKITTVLDDSLSQAGAFGVDKGKKLRVEIGMNLNLKLDYDLATNVNFKTGVNLFSSYDPYFVKRIDVNWETLLTLKVNKYISTTFGTQLIYDHDILIKQKDNTSIQAVQFKHVLNVNFSYKFEGKKMSLKK